MFEIRNPQYKDRIREYLSRQYFMKHVGIELTVIKPGHVEAELNIEQTHLQQFGRIHGGVIATIADIAAGFAAYTLVPEEFHVVTGEIKISYFRPGKGHRLKAVGKVIKPGKSMSFCEAEIWSLEGGKEILIGKASTSMVNIPIVEG